jgi:hypothetical protein
MLNYLVELARAKNPVRSRRYATLRLAILVVFIAVAPPLVSWGFQPHRGLVVDFSLDIVQIVAFSALIVVVVPSVALYSRQRRRRERFLRKNTDLGQSLGSVYLSPPLVAFMEREALTPLNRYTESVTLILKSSAIEFWSGGPMPSRAASITFNAIESVELEEDEEHFMRPKLWTRAGVIPLYATVGWIGISRRSSRRLYDRLLVALFEAKNSPALGE